MSKYQNGIRVSIALPTLNLVAGLVLVIGLMMAGCRSGKDENTVRVGVMSGPGEELMAVAAKVALERYGFKIKIVPFSDYAMPNAALVDGSIDANMMQHQPYLDAAIQSRGYKLTSIGKTFVYPMGIYSKRTKDVKTLGPEIVAAIPNDPSNETRALLLLEKAGIIELEEVTRMQATPRSIRQTQKRVRIKELDAAQLVRALDDVDVAAINTNYAVAANLYPSRDALFVENEESVYANIVVVRTERQGEERLKQLVSAIQSPEVKAEVLRIYKGQAIAAY